MNDDEIDLSVVQDDPAPVAPNSTPYNGSADDANSGAVSWLGDLSSFIKGAAQTVGELRSAGFITTPAGGPPAAAPAPAAGANVGSTGVMVTAVLIGVALIVALKLKSK